MLQNKDSYQYFKSTLENSTAHSLVAMQLFSFFENYWGLLNVINQRNYVLKPGFVSKVFPKRALVIESFLHPASPSAASKFERVVKNIPSQLVHRLLVFYKSFVALNATFLVPFISTQVRDSVSTRIIHASTTRVLSVQVFDTVAQLALDTLFGRCYSRFLSITGKPLGVMKMVKDAHKEFTRQLQINPEIASIISPLSALGLTTPSKSSKPTREGFSFFFRIGSTSLQLPGLTTTPGNFTLSRDKQTMVKVLLTSAHYARFRSYIITQNPAYEIIIECIEEFLEIETLLNSALEMQQDATPSIFAYFLDPVKQSTPPCYITISILPLYLLFHQKYIISHEKLLNAVLESCIQAKLNRGDKEISDMISFELEISRTIFTEVAREIHKRIENREPVDSGIFYPALDLVLEGIFLNFYLQYVDSFT